MSLFFSPCFTVFYVTFILCLSSVSYVTFILTVFSLFILTFSLFSFMCHLFSMLCHCHLYPLFSYVSLFIPCPFYPLFSYVTVFYFFLCRFVLTVYPCHFVLTVFPLFILCLSSLCHFYPLSLLSSVCLIYLAQYRYDKIRYANSIYC